MMQPQLIPEWLNSVMEKVDSEDPPLMQQNKIFCAIKKYIVKRYLKIFDESTGKKANTRSPTIS